LLWARIGGIFGLLMASPFDPLPANRFGVYEAAHLLWRAGFGGTWEDIQALAARGLPGAVAALTGFPLSTEFAPDFITLPQPDEGKDGKPDEREKINQLRFWWLNRMVNTPNPLEEKMTLFWHGHFATSFEDKIEAAYPMWHQNQMFRRLALGPFPSLLSALIRDPAMLVFLDNAESVKDRPNENLARELMELHSLGVGNFSESDVKAAAHSLTGFGVNRDKWTFRYDAEQHDPGQKTYLGQTGPWSGDDVVRIICAQPACGLFIGRKLLEYFVYGNPEPEILNEAAALLRSTNYDFRKFLATVFSSQLFYSVKAQNSIVKSPVALTIGALKSMRAQPPQGGLLSEALRNMGQDLFFPPEVNGWVGGAAWINSNMLLVRYNFANYLLNGVNPEDFHVYNQKAAGPNATRRQFVESQRTGAVKWTPRQQLRDLGIDQKMLTSGDVVDYYINTFLARPVSSEMRDQFLAFMETDAAGGHRSFSLDDSNFDERIHDLAHLMMSSPDYQLC
jgi:uncharacterized protein (DUF1800 family)